jgi:hypothetical protein
MAESGNPTERPEERDSLPTWDEINLLVDTDPLALRDLARTLINEVKERDEKLAELEPYNERLDRRVEQMEEALREAEQARDAFRDEMLRLGEGQGRAALSPSDTEEEA